MKLKPRDIPGFLSKPQASVRAALFYGADPTQVKTAARHFRRTLLGADDDPFRLTIIAADDLTRNTGMLADSLNALSFGGGDTVTEAHDVSDKHFSEIEMALDRVSEGSFLILTSGELSPRSRLRKCFETAAHAAALPFYALETGDRLLQLERALQGRGTPDFDRDGREAARGALEALSFGEINHFAEQLSLYKHLDETPLSAEDVRACTAAPQSDIDTLIRHMADGRPAELSAVMQKVFGHGGQTQTILPAARRYLYRLYQVVAALRDGDSLDTALRGLRPPLFFKERDAFTHQARRWQAEALERALGLITEAEGVLRGGRNVPEKALVERTIIRIALLQP